MLLPLGFSLVQHWLMLTLTSGKFDKMSSPFGMISAASGVGYALTPQYAEIRTLPGLDSRRWVGAGNQRVDTLERRWLDGWEHPECIFLRNQPTPLLFRTVDLGLRG